MSALSPPMRTAPRGPTEPAAGVMAAGVVSLGFVGALAGGVAAWVMAGLGWLLAGALLGTLLGIALGVVVGTMGVVNGLIRLELPQVALRLGRLLPDLQALAKSTAKVDGVRVVDGVVEDGGGRAGEASFSAPALSK